MSNKVTKEQWTKHYQGQRKYTQEEKDFLDKCAIAAMQGICVNAGRNRYVFDKPDEIARDAYNVAKSMLEARKEALKNG